MAGKPKSETLTTKQANLVHKGVLHEPHVLRQPKQSISLHRSHSTQHFLQVLDLHSLHLSQHLSQIFVDSPMLRQWPHVTMQILQLYSSVAPNE